MAQLAVVQDGKIVGVLGELHAFEGHRDATVKDGKVVKKAATYRFIALDNQYNATGKTVNAEVDGVTVPVRLSRTATLAIDVPQPAKAGGAAPKMLASDDFKKYMAEMKAAITNA